MPGVSVTTTIRQGAGGEDIVPSSTFFVAGTAPRGPSDEAVMVLSTADFEKVYGKYDAATSLHAAVRTFFGEGGTRCYVARAISGGAPATVTTNVTVQAATTGNIAIADDLLNSDVIDGVTLTNGDLVLVKDQTDSEDNGIYVVGGTPARSGAYNEYGEYPGVLVDVAGGATNGNKSWQCTSTGSGTIDTTPITFAQVYNASSVVLANGGNEFVTVTAVGIGTSYEDIDVVVADGYGADTVRISVVDGGTTIWRSGDLATAGAIVSAINANVGYLVTATLAGNAGDGTATGDDNLPEFSTFTLAGGNDSAPVDADDVADAIDNLFGADLGPGAVAAPGFAYDAEPGDDMFGERLLAHCAANRRIALLAPDSVTDGTALKADVPAWYGKENAEYGAIYFPWVRIPDGLGGAIEVSPEAYVAGARARAHTHTGPWKPGAGEVAASQYVTGLYLPGGQSWTRADADELDSYQVNTIRIINGSVRVYGASTLSGDVANWRFITYRDTVNAIIGLVEVALEPYVFAPIDSRGGVFGQIDASIRALLAAFAAAGGLYARTVDDEEVDPGYTVLVDSVNNPQSELAEGRISAEVGLRVSPIGETINVTIYKSGLTTAI